ncbi:hypothetical protein CPB97_004416 [Podila verticillata]|nr:hypothetical protein CPB97_004416 [Podila verticillata]
MSIAPSSILTCSVETTIRIDCSLEELLDHTVTLAIAADVCPHIQNCAIRLLYQSLYVSFKWKSDLQFGTSPALLTHFRALHVLAQDEQPISAELVHADRFKITFRISTSDVAISDKVVFKVIFSTSDDTKRDSKLSEQPSRRSEGTMAALMKDIGTMDVALTFGLNGRGRNVALWAHQSVLAQEPGLAKLIRKLKAVEGSSTDLAVVPKVQSYHVTEYSLEAYCCFIRFLYSGEVEIEVDLDDFAIGYPPNKPFSVHCNERPTLEELFPSGSSISTDPHSGKNQTVTNSLVRWATFSEVFQLADCYEVGDLRLHCRDRIIGCLSVSNSLSVLFGFGYRFEDIKIELLKYVVDNLDKMYATCEDPFEDFKDHPHRPTLLAEILKIKFKS